MPILPTPERDAEIIAEVRMCMTSDERAAFDAHITRFSKFPMGALASLVAAGLKVLAA